jgi:hypothetical protein
VTQSTTFAQAQEPQFTGPFRLLMQVGEQPDRFSLVAPELQQRCRMNLLTSTATFAYVFPPFSFSSSLD